MTKEPKKNHWHDLRKDPNDLPKLRKDESYKTVFVLMRQYCQDWYDIANYSDGSFFINGDDESENVIEWCETGVKL